MRVALIQDYLRSGGTENQTLHIARGLAEAGINSHVIVFRSDGFLEAKAEKSPFKLHHLRQGPLKTDWFAPGLAKLLEEIDPQVAIAMGRMANCHAGWLATRKRDYRLVATCRTGKTLPWLYRRALRLADRIVVNSREAARRLKEKYEIDRPDETEIIYNGCIRDFNTTIPSLRPPAKGKRPVRIASISMFRPEKRQIDLLRICSLLRHDLDWRLTLAGDGPEQTSCLREAERLGIANRVEFPGLLSDPRPLYEESDLAAHCSQRESLPNFLVEAQMAGLPVVAYQTGGVAETFLDNRSGFLIEAGDEHSFLDRLERLIESPDLRLQMSQAARDYAMKNFSPQAQLGRYLQLLEKL